MIRFGSVCSGIEAASVAWGPLGWKAAWLAEIEPFPCAVLAHHYPDVPNLGDMTLIADLVTAGEVEAPDVLCGGTPCQSFSVAGKRASLQDARGNLSLSFCNLADTIDAKRDIRGEPACVVVWENVFGLLSTKDNAFGCFLGALAGAGDALQPPRKPNGKPDRWPDAGVVLGPRRAIAWRILDAQYFGLAQRRRRVFVVASARKGFDPATVLFEWDGVRRDTAPSREARQVAPTIPARSTAGGGLGTDFDCDGGVITMANGQGGEGFDASEDGTGRGTPLVPVSVALRGREGGGTAEVGDDLAFTLRASDGGGDKPHVLAPVAFHEVAGTLKACAGKSGTPNGAEEADRLVGMTFMADDYKSGSFSEVAGPLTTTADRTRGAPIAFSCKDHAADAADDLAPTLRAMNHADSHANAGGQVAVAYTGEDHGNAQEAGPREALLELRAAIGEEAFFEWRLGVAASFWTPEVLRKKLHGAGLRCEADEAERRLDDRPLPRQEGGPAWALREVWEAGCQRRAPQGRGLPEQRSGELDSALSKLSHEGAQPEGFLLSLWRSGEGFGLLQSALPAVQGRQALAVRRLMPVETERLQGFPDGWTMIPWRGKPAELCPDGPRYKAIGNSWAVNVAAWLGARIDAAIRDLNRTQEAQAA